VTAAMKPLPLTAEMGLASILIDGMFSAAEICAMAKCIGCGFEEAKPTYACLWDRIYGKRPGLAWADNPWVSVTKWDKMVAI